MVCTRAMQDIVCTAVPYASHDLARKNAKFMKLSATRHSALGRCGEYRRSNTLTVTSNLMGALTTGAARKEFYILLRFVCLCTDSLISIASTSGE